MNIGANRQLSGEYGGLYINDTSAHNNTAGGWCEIRALTATVVASSTSNISGLSAFSLAAGQTVAGVFTAITLTSGSVIAYNRKHG